MDPQRARDHERGVRLCQSQGVGRGNRRRCAAARPRRRVAPPEDIPLRVVFEDDQILVIDKPAGMVVHPGSGNWSGTLLNALLRHTPQLSGVPRAGIVHRLDKDTSGLLVVAKTIPAQVNLTRQLQARSVTANTLRWCTGWWWRDGVVEAPIGRHPVSRTRMAVVARGKAATTRYAVLERGPSWSLLRCRLETGRTHQIRVHLYSIRHPLIGDPVYRLNNRGTKLPAEALDFHRQALHARRLALVHPQTGQTLTWQAPTPLDIARCCRYSEMLEPPATGSSPDWPAPANVRALITTRSGGVSTVLSPA